MSRRLSPQVKQDFLSDAARKLLKDRFYQMFGLILSALSVLIILTLVSYNPTDPSLNTAATLTPYNILDYPGAIVADLLYQYFGLSSYMFSVALIGCGLALLRLKMIPHFSRRSLLFCIGLMGLALFLNYFSSSSDILATSLKGGSLGLLLSTLLLKVTKVPFTFLFAVVGLAIALLSFNYALSLNLFEVIRKTSNFMMLILAKAVFYLTKSNRPIPAKKQTASHPTTAASNPSLVRSYQPITMEDDQDDELDLDQTAAIDTLAEPLSPLKKVTAAVSRAKTIQKAVAPSYPQEMTEDYQLPAVDLLDKAVAKQAKAIADEVLQNYARQLEGVLQEFGVRGEIVAVCPGPVVTLYELKPAPGIKTSRVIGLADDIARSMSALSARIAVIPGRNVIGIELPNHTRETVYMRDLLLSDEYAKHSAHLAIILGKDIGGNPIIADLSRMPHLLVAGTTGSGKSVSINTMILSVLFRMPPDQCKFIMIDPKMLELSIYDGIPHLLTPVVTDPKKAVIALKWAVREMENRYRAMSKLGVRNIDGFNARIQEARSSGELLMRRVQTGFDPDTGKPIFENQSLDVNLLPYIVIVVDEMADLMLVAGKEIEGTVQRLAQMARAAGIHLIMATQRPSVDVITGTIKANFPTRISFMVTSKIDSRTILGEQGAEQLLGQGDMLYMVGGGRIMRVHAPFVKDAEVERIVQFLKAQGEPSYIDSITESDEEGGAGGDGDDENKGGDNLYSQAVEIVRREGKASTSFVQRHLQIGYNRAARIIEQMEKEGLVSPANHVGKREILM